MLKTASVVVALVSMTSTAVWVAHARAGSAQPAPAPAAQVVKLEVTREGFVPKQVKVVKGKPVKLEVTRKTDKTCATELVMKDQNIRLELPLDKTVSVTFTPQKAGQLRYACGMDMISGVLVVE